MTTQRIEFDLLGRRVGTFTGWDQHDTMIFTYYGVQPYTALGLPSGDWDVDYDKGSISVGEQMRDIVEIIASLPLA